MELQLHHNVHAFSLFRSRLGVMSFSLVQRNLSGKYPTVPRIIRCIIWNVARTYAHHCLYSLITIYVAMDLDFDIVALVKPINIASLPYLFNIKDRLSIESYL